MSPYRQYVASNERWFRGRHPETEESMNQAEHDLGVALPDDLRWVLITHGYWHGTGISSLEETVERTVAARRALDLPSNLVVLYDHDEGGVFLLDTARDPESGENPVWGAAWEDVPDRLSSAARFESLKAYAEYLVEEEGVFLSEEDIDYDPSDFGDPQRA
jgi:hypothetical protein